jgi:4-methyl-5(b-hydroxyethyl)-thiazole monophosphate biosynthesis
MFKAAILLAPGFEIGEAIVCIDLLLRAEVKVDLVGINDLKEVTSNQPIIKLTPVIDVSRMDPQSYDLLLLPGGSQGVSNLLMNDLVKEKISLFAALPNKILAAVCAAPSILGKLNLLNGKKATCYPGYERTLKGATIVQESHVRSGNIITGSSLGSIFSFALSLIEALYENTDSTK